MPLSRTRSRAGRNLGNWYSVSDVTTGKCVTGIPTVPTGTVTTAVPATASIPAAAGARAGAGAGAGAFTSRIGGVAAQNDLDRREVDCPILGYLARSCDVEGELGTYGDDRTVVSVGDR